MAAAGAPVAEVSSTPAANAAVAQSRGTEPPVGPPCPPGKAPDGRPRAFHLGKGVTAAAAAARYERRPDDPIYRPLKIYTIDPSSRRLEGQTAQINVPFEALEPGPVGARFEVVAAPGGPLGTYCPVDLDDPRLLIVNGRNPAPTDPVFHHQMVYAAAMSTYAVFRAALGREPTWAFGGQRLKLVPHAMEDANARYIRGGERLEFGWYRVEAGHAGDLPPEGLVFACLSHDVVAHELTHALLDGLRPHFDKATNPDVPAFHEAFADLVALLQRFSYKEVVRSNILRTSGDLSREGDLLSLGLELASGRGSHALRTIDLEAEKKYDAGLGEHDLGTVLVSAVIEACLTIYRRRAAPLIRMATGGRKAVLDEEGMSEDLVDALSHLASRLASQMLAMCVRAIDYCPPVDITLGEYLRALITADHDLVPDDPYAYREALIVAFRRRRIYPPGVAALTEDALLWKPVPAALKLEGGAGVLLHGPGRSFDAEELVRRAELVGEMVCADLDQFGLAAPDDTELQEFEVDLPTVESVRSVRRVGPDGQLAFDLVAEVTQRCRDPGGQGLPAVEFHGGATIILDAQGRVRLVVTKSVKNKRRLADQRKYASAGVEYHELRRCRHEKRDGR